MMKPNKKAKWIVGITGTALSAFILSQLDANPASNNQVNQPVVSQNKVAVENTNGVSDREQELANKDWSNFTVESNSENQSKAQSAEQPKAQPTNPTATEPTITQPAAQQPVTPPTDRNTSRS